MTEPNVLVVTFADRWSALAGFCYLEFADYQERLVLRAAHLVDRNVLGHITVPEGVQIDCGSLLWGDGLVAVLIGLRGGPRGILGQISSSIPRGGAAIVAAVDEWAPETVDVELAAMGGTVDRRPAEQVLADMQAAEAETKRLVRAQRKAARKEHFAHRAAALSKKLRVSRSPAVGPSPGTGPGHRLGEASTTHRPAAVARHAEVAHKRRDPMRTGGSAAVVRAAIGATGCYYLSSPTAAADYHHDDTGRNPRTSTITDEWTRP